MVLDDPLFGPEDEADEVVSVEPWTVLVVDDDPQVHAMTSVLLRDFAFDGRPFAVVSALSAAEAGRILAARPDIPVVLLDVVMETNDAGLRLVRHIREELNNHRLRIILRTGQPGQAPERDVVVTYDINDYKAKSELTAQKLFTSLVSALRAWRDIVAIERNRQGLQRILDASAPLLATRSMRLIVEGMVDQLPRVVAHDGGSVLACREGAGPQGRQPVAVAGSGRFAALVGQPADAGLGGDGAAAVAAAFASGASLYGSDRCVLVFRTLEHGATVFVMERPEPYSEDEHRLLQVFCERIAVGFDQACLHEDLLALNRTLEQRVEERTAELAASRAALAAAKERAETALAREMEARQQQRQFVAMVSHEFRTPLAVIDSAAQMLALRAREAAPDMLDRLCVVRTSVHRLTGIIETYLTDERLLSGSLTLDRRAVDLGALLRATIEHQRVAHPDHAFALDLAEPPPTVVADAHLLDLAFANLIGNAVKYSDRDPRVAVRGHRDGDGVVVEVRDHGCGIPASELPHVFTRFFRGSNTAGIAGTGIGLHTVKQIVELHGGSVEVTSTVDVGTTFRVLLPACAGEA
ncbi:ATP-binding response regulator [Azospirillum sp. ST 5-10]|uniref:sensor histidine kinase n=1 Tax=unclassified Azospirillum TaxID=2630922 RepID=UPI003F49FD1E